ncbi:MAG: MFS transporter, partial [Polyangia bacterium]
MSADPSPSPAYLRRLLLFLGLVAFFDGYDLFAISQTLPELRRTFALTPAAGSRLLALANLGTIAAYLMVRLADRWGRRPVLTLCLVGYSGASLLSGVAPSSGVFLVGQIAVRLFLISALALAVLYATEEFPAERRGRTIALIQACFSVGAIGCAAVTPRLLQTGLGWRAVYLFGASSIGLLLFAARGLRETGRFLRTAQRPAHRPPLLPQLPRAPHRKRVLQLASVWLVTFLCNQSAVVFWKEYAQAERGLSSQRIGAWMALAAVGALPLVVLAGRLIDGLGRRRAAVVIYGLTALGVLGAYTQVPEPLLPGAMLLLIGGMAAAVTLLSTWTAESFPTALRGDCFGWANSLLGRLGFVLAPLLVAELVPALGWRRTLLLSAAFPAVALLLILWWLPETAGSELDAATAPEA